MLVSTIWLFWGCTQ